MYNIDSHSISSRANRVSKRVRKAAGAIHHEHNEHVTVIVTVTVTVTVTATATASTSTAVVCGMTIQLNI